LGQTSIAGFKQNETQEVETVGRAIVSKTRYSKQMTWEIFIFSTQCRQKVVFKTIENNNGNINKSDS